MAIACAATSSALNIGSEMREAIIGKLCSVLEWENDLSRCCAIKALGQIGAQQAASSLIDRLLHDPDADVRMEAAAALGSLSVPQATEPLINALRHDPDGNARIEACLTLGKIGGPLAVEALIQALREDRQPSCNADDALPALAVLQQVYDQMVTMEGEAKYRRRWGL